MFDIYYGLTDKGKQELARSHRDLSQPERERVFYLTILKESPRALTAEEISLYVKGSKSLAPLTIMGRKFPIEILKYRPGAIAIAIDYVDKYMEHLAGEGFVTGIGLAHDFHDLDELRDRLRSDRGG